MFTSRVLVTIGGVVGLSMATLAQPSDPAPAAPAVNTAPAKDAQPAAPAHVMSKEAADLIAKAQAAAKTVNDVTATVESVNGDKTSKGKVVIVLQDGQIPFGNWRFEPVPAKADGPTKVFAFDGTTIRITNSKKKEMTESAVQGFGIPSGDAGNLIPMWFMDIRQDRLGHLGLQVVEQVIETGADEKIDGEKVVTVRQIREAKLSAEQGGGVERTVTETVRMSLGSDNLARRYEQTFEATGKGGMKQVTKQTYTDVKVNKAPAADTFALKAPAGYTTRTLDPNGPNLAVSEGDAALNFSLKDADGKTYTLADFKGKVVLMDFWATWCGPCKMAMPSVQKIHEAFKDKGVAVIGVDTWEREDGAGPAYIKEKGYTYLNLVKGDDLAKEYEINAIPTMLLLDKEGKIIRILQGFGDEEEAELTKLINEKLK
ncbi:MAG: TlpA disulfide reductase family protein [Phycisphaerales bacterium]